jgi:hypothetical protein
MSIGTVSYSAAAGALPPGIDNKATASNLDKQRIATASHY